MVLKSIYSEADFERQATVAPGKVKEVYRSGFRRDYARLIHCPSFRRLQGKTQVFPGHESDFFRNRLSHSLEVAQIAKSIAIKLNSESEYFARPKHKIDLDLVEFAGLSHDIGHPPFGHNGEAALDECMLDNGGFEGNAQTFRILSRLEKKSTAHLVDGAVSPIDQKGRDIRVGLNLTYRSLAATLKYDNELPVRASERKKSKKFKGYYASDRKLVDTIKRSILGSSEVSKFKTIECSIMDVADDIAYSTYDLEDNFKAGFLSPLELFSLDRSILQKVADTTAQRLDEHFPELPATKKKFLLADVYKILFETFTPMFGVEQEEIEMIARGKLSSRAKMFLSTTTLQNSEKIASDGYERVKFTSGLVQNFIQGVRVLPHEKFAQLHQVRLDLRTFKRVEVLKNITYEAVIMSPKMQVVEYRGKDIVQQIFAALDSKKGSSLLPDDYKKLYESLIGPERKRVICDFIAGMTDRYAFEFYSRLYGGNQTIHKPL